MLKTVRVGNVWSTNYIKYESNSGRKKNSSVEEYLNKHYVKIIRIRSYSGPHFLAFGPPYSVPIQGNKDQNNSQHRHFSRSEDQTILKNIENNHKKSETTKIQLTIQSTLFLLKAMVKTV